MDNKPTTKICSKCKIEKPISEFRKQTAAKSGLHPFCSVCHSISSKKSFEKNREKLREQAKIWYAENREKLIKSPRDKNKQIRKYFLEEQKKNKDILDQKFADMSIIDRILDLK